MLTLQLAIKQFPPFVYDTSPDSTLAGGVLRSAGVWLEAAAPETINASKTCPE